MEHNITLDLATLVIARKELVTVLTSLNPIEQAHFNNGVQLAINVLTDMISKKGITNENSEVSEPINNNIKEDQNNE